MKKKGLLILGIVAGLSAMGCSALDQRPVYGANEVVIFDDGETVITSTKETNLVVQADFATKWNTTMNVWRIEQELLKYYKYGGTVYVSGQLKVRAGVNNVAYNKVVGIRYTLNNWASYKDYNGYWVSHDNYANTDTFEIFSESTIQPGTLVKYAVYYKVNGATYWDNNYGKNYSAQF